MESARRSLREVVESWLSPNRAIPVRVRLFRLSSLACGRYVRVEAKAATGLVAICFFRHEDGSWCVFPPGPRRPAMRVS
ncbi:hypothetical protein BZM26_00410 [Paraburkholderia strydomiana]|nr:hypothetical protein BZM26_00410 [Paraburkholderia strydomiana]